MRTEIFEKTRRPVKRSVKVDNLIYLRADAKYVDAYHTEGVLTLDEPLDALEQELGDRLLRIHRGVLVARDRALEVERVDGHYRLHVAGLIETLPVARRKGPELRRMLRGEA